MADPNNFMKSKSFSGKEPFLIAHADHSEQSEQIVPNSETTIEQSSKPAKKEKPTKLDKPTDSTDKSPSSAPKPIDIHRLPNGDGHLVTGAQALKPGEVLVTPQSYEQMKNGQTGAVANGTWINSDGTYDLTKR